MEDSDEFDDEEITKILREALKIKLDDRKKIPSKIQLHRALISTLSEFMTCFKLIGFDLDGNPINFTIYKEKIQKSALDNSFMEEFGKFMESRS